MVALHGNASAIQTATLTVWLQVHDSFICVFFLLPQENTDIEEATRCLVEHILNNEEVTERDPGSLVLSGYTNTTKDHLSCLSCAK